MIRFGRPRFDLRDPGPRPLVPVLASTTCRPITTTPAAAVRPAPRRRTAAAWTDIENLAVRLRKDPITGDVPGPNGVVEPVTMNVVGLVDLTNDGAGDPDIYRDLDAAARALLTSSDPDPLCVCTRNERPSRRTTSTPRPAPIRASSIRPTPASTIPSCTT